MRSFIKARRLLRYCKGSPFAVFWGILLFLLGYLPVLPAGHAGELTNDADGVIGGLQQMGYVLQGITGDEVSEGD